jgi:NADPH:quinone reductase-like Zn-dependent oxidoreductase
MKAIAITGPGASPALADLPAPSPAEGELLVRVRASSLNGFDLSVAHGKVIGMMEHRYPVVLGKDFAGTVEAVGAGVDGFATGDPVFGVVIKPYLGDGGLGELVATPAAFLARVPAGVDLVVAGALGLAGTAAADAVDAINPNKGETVLVAGATGGVGAIAIQLLRARGATVIATAASADERALVTGLGAHSTVDHSGDLALAVRSAHRDGVDAALHLAGDGGTLAALVRRGGRMASALGFSAEQADRHDLTVAPIMANPSTASSPPP